MNPMADIPPTSPSMVEQTLETIRKAKEQISSARETLERHMEAPGGMEWEHQISSPPEPEGPEESLELTEAEKERQLRVKEQFERNWPQRLGQIFRRKPWRGGK